jgi:outer membrane lipoprotein SlyB
MTGACGNMQGTTRTLCLVERLIVNAWKKSASMLALASTLVLSGCAPLHYPGWEKDYPPFAQSAELQPGYGTVHAIEKLRAEERGIGVGAVAGAVIGGLIGNQVGDGDGNTAATVIGAAGGALIGHQIEKKVKEKEERYQLTIRMENGSFQTLVQKHEFVDLRVGDRLFIDKEGAVRRY